MGALLENILENCCPDHFSISEGADKSRIKKALDVLRAETEWLRCVNLAHLINKELPDALIFLLNNFRRYGNSSGVIIIDGIPLDADLPATPMHANSVADTSCTSAAALLLILTRLGDPIAYIEEKQGALVHDICPVPGEEEQQQNTGSVYFKLHTENAFHPNLPDFLGLICLRQDPDRRAKLITSSILEALPLLQENVIAVLREPRFRTRLAPSFLRGAVDRPYMQPTPLLSGTIDYPTMKVDYDDTIPLDSSAERAMNSLHEALQQVRREHHLQEGALALLDNRVTVHGRTAFVPRYDGTDRWLQRMFVVSTIRGALPNVVQGSNFCVQLKPPTTWKYP